MLCGWLFGCESQALLVHNQSHLWSQLPRCCLSTPLPAWLLLHMGVLYQQQALVASTPPFLRMLLQWPAFEFLGKLPHTAP
jgi:hypothetical protein